MSAKHLISETQSDLVISLVRLYALFRDASSRNYWYGMAKYGTAIKDRCRDLGIRATDIAIDFEVELNIAQRRLSQDEQAALKTA